MPQRSNKFQRLVFLIQKALSDQYEVRESEMLVDRISGKRREVDIVIRTKAGAFPFIIGIECAARKRRATIEWVEGQADRHSRLTNKLILVSERGFCRDALEEAQRRGIETHTLDELLKDVRAIERMVVGLTMVLTNLDAPVCTIGCSDPPEGIGTNPMIYAADGRSLGTLDDFWRRTLDSMWKDPAFGTAVNNGMQNVMIRLALKESCYVLGTGGKRIRITYLGGPATISREKVDVPLEQLTFAGRPMAYGELPESIPGKGVLIAGEEDGSATIVIDYGGDTVRRVSENGYTETKTR